VTWTIRYEREAERAIDATDPPMRRRILLAIGSLNRDPRGAANVEAMKGQQIPASRWRLAGDL
jgi:hypothetical protein